MVDVLVVEVDVLVVEVEVVEVEVELVDVVGLVVVVLELLDSGSTSRDVDDDGIVVLGVVPSSSEVARKMAMPPRTTSTNSTITAMPSGDDQGDLDGAGSAGAVAGAGSAA